jgi:hypothetical protein
MNIEESEKEYINSVSNNYESKQIECIELAKQFAMNASMFNKYYPIYYTKSKEFCEEFRIPMKPVVS